MRNKHFRLAGKCSLYTFPSNLTSKKARCVVDYKSVNGLDKPAKWLFIASAAQYHAVAMEELMN